MNKRLISMLIATGIVAAMVGCSNGDAPSTAPTTGGEATAPKAPGAGGGPQAGPVPTPGPGG